MYECMNERDLYDCINCRWLYDCIIAYDKRNSMKRDKTGKMGGGLTSQYKHSANFLGDDIIVNKSSRWQGKTRYKVATDVSWG